MTICCDEQNGLFTLHTKFTTYQMKADRLGYLLHLYYGPRMEGSAEYLITYADRGFSGNPYEAGGDRTYSLDALPQEYPFRGEGDYRSTALIAENADGSVSTDLRYAGYHIREGKYSLPGLPAMYGQAEEAETLEIDLEDTASGLQITLLYGVFPELDIITRAVRIKNAGQQPIVLRKAGSACLDCVPGEYDLITFHGRHAMERNWQRIGVEHGSYSVGSRRGTSSHQYSPFVILARHGADEDAGECWGMSFVYSGEFRAEAEKDQYGQTRLLMGIQDEAFAYPLAPGETFTGPEVILSYSAEGLAALSHRFHRAIRENLCREPERETPRPVLINSWEAAYFDFTGETICNIAEEAAQLGVDMVVMDDGWFGNRSSDSSGLGDWVVNEKKLGCTLGELSEKIHECGLEFGLWVEPEMVSEDSDLYREHPDWAYRIPGRKPVRSRFQLVLDLSRREVVDYLFESLCRVLDSAQIEYIKWDMNRSITDVYSANSAQGGGTANPGAVLYRYVLGLYDLLERLRTRYPKLLIEGCSGGGGRFDAGMLYYTPLIWCSDNTDAIERIRIQHGTSFGFPVSSVGSHVSAVPNHQTGRIVPMKTRGVVAMAGNFGYELNPADMTREEKEEVRRQIREFKELRPLIHEGLYYRLTNPFEEREAAAWSFVSEDRREALVSVVTLETHGNPTTAYIRLKGLEKEAVYRDRESGACYPGAALMTAGIPVPAMSGEYQAWQLRLEKVESGS
ncbi:MAG: alpha-galactosidase [Eubacteriales bacterium]|nr:alpha-galactosidase [Eubacteriales bacterium]